MSNSDEIRWQQRFENFTKALSQLTAACKKGEYSDLEQAGLVPLFRSTFELGWKTLKDFLSYNDIIAKTPRDVIIQAQQAGDLTESDMKLWLEALVDQNRFRTCDAQTRMEAERLIVGQYQPMLRRLFDVLDKKRKR